MVGPLIGRDRFGGQAYHWKSLFVLNIVVEETHVRRLDGLFGSLNGDLVSFETTISEFRDVGALNEQAGVGVGEQSIACFAPKL